MDFFLFKSETGLKVIMVLLFWGVQWFYGYLTASVGSTSNKELDEDEDEDEDEDKVKATAPAKPIPITRKGADKLPQATLCPQIVAKNFRSPQPASGVIKAGKSHLGSKRKFFRNALLMDALMHRKDCIVP